MRYWSIVALLIVAACQQQPKPPQKPTEPTFDGAQFTNSAATIAHGERISWTLGCRGCHRENLEGGTFYERYASNLTRDLPKYSDAEIEHVLRTGVPRDGRELWGMPSEIFQHLSAADMKALIANLRSTAPGGKPTQPPKPWEADAQEMIAKGDLKPAKDTVSQDKLIAPVELGSKYALGRYVARVTCAECHGAKLEGAPSAKAGEPPNLAVVGGYTRAEFETLMTKGIPPGGRKLKNPLMGEVARERFTHFTPHERDAIYTYLKARAEIPQ
jgi:mono/diheme cytochrome c family protein